MTMAVSDDELECLWEGEEEHMDEEDKDWLIERLRDKVFDLKEQLRLVSTFGEGSSVGGAGPIAHIIYFNNVESLASRRRVDELMQNLASFSRGAQLQMEAVTHYHQPSAILISSSDGGVTGEDGEEEVCVVGSVEYYSGFCLDWRGVPMREVGGGGEGGGGRDIEWKPNDDTSVLYGQVYLEPFWVDAVRQREEKRLRKMSIVCFNCGDDHHLKDCPEPKDFSRIYAKRVAFMASLGTSGADKRYRMTQSDDRFKKFVPGKISEKLRKALGLMNSTDYPPYIYRMRELDYPPGYRLLTEETSLKMYDNCGDVAEKENEGVIRKEDIIIYPGFNSPDVVSTPTTYQLGCGKPPSSKTEGDKNREKLKEWLSSKDTDPHRREEEEREGAGEDMDDLGTLSDYEFEEAKMTENGEEVVGFGLRKLLKTVPKEANSDEKFNKPSPKPRKQFSLDFPPGLVHDESECVKSPKNWKIIKSILDEKRPKKTDKRKKLKI